MDVTLADEIERAGYAGHLAGDGIDLRAALTLAPPRAPASPHPDARWRQIAVNAGAGTITRPPGLRIDVGGIAKGVFADELAVLLEGFDAYVLDCAGDLRVGGRAGLVRPVHVTDPFAGARAGTFGIAAGAVATSGIGRRSWTTRDGRPAHHLLDPHTGAPGVQRHRPGHRAGADRRPGRGAGQGGHPLRAGARPRMALARRSRGL